MADLAALPYHRGTADWLERHQPTGWAALSAPAPGSHAEPESLARSAYRLEPSAHPTVHAALARAAENLGVREPVSVFQAEAGGSAANAWLVTLPGELAVVLAGNLLQLLPEAGLCAVFGHELAHHVLGTLEGGRYATARRLLDLLEVDAATPLPYLETARRFQLATELFADRGAVVACGDLHVAVGALVTTVTGLAEADPVAYLAQAEAAAPAAGSQTDGHPETVLRAWALGRWAAEDSGAEVGPGEAAARTLLRPRLDLDRLDVFDRAELERVTQVLIEGMLLEPQWRSEPVLAHARQFFPALGVPSGEAGAAWGTPEAPGVWGTPEAGRSPVPADAAPSTLRYLSYVLLDLVTADPDADQELAVAAGLRFAQAAGLAADFERVARAELGLSAAAGRRIGAAAGQVSR